MTEVNKQLTFDSRDDFNRRPIAEKIIQLLKSDIKISPMVIDGGWGSGKTEFTHKLLNLFNENLDNYKLIYIDAFQADNADEPLITLMASLINVLPEPKDKIKLRKKAIPAIRFGVKTILKAGVSWVLKQDATDIADDFDDDIKNACDESINSSIDNLLKDHQQADESIEALKIALSKITSESPVIFFIDELDRCRPDFAIKMLEKIKHIFDASNIQFVLIANKEQLRSSINHIYGSSISAQKYLDKFLSYSLSLATSHSHYGYDFEYYPIQHFFNLIHESEVLDDDIFNKYDTKLFIKKLFQVNDISLREVETLVLHIEIYQNLNKNFKNMLLGHFLFNLLGIFIFCFKPVIQKKIEVSIYDAKELNSLFDVRDLQNKNDDYFYSYEGIIVSVIFLEANKNTLKNPEEFNLNQEQFDMLKSQINSCFDRRMMYDDSKKLKILLDTVNTLKFV